MSGQSSDPRRAYSRVCDMLDAISSIHSLLDGATLEAMKSKGHMRAAFERYLEILSEASRHVPEDWKTEYGAQIDWRAIRDIGNRLRHGYDQIDHLVLWDIYKHDLDALAHALEAMVAANKL
jgi:uncharacterized protein with HEPN domain